MNDPGVTVLIPVGPKYNKEWLQEAVNSAVMQTYFGEIEILILDDGAKITQEEFVNLIQQAGSPEYTGELWLEFPEDNVVVTADRYIYMYQLPWNVGFAQAFNMGVGVARDDLVIYLASDDRLMDTAVEEMVDSWNQHNQKDAFYSCSYEINGETHTIPINVGMVTRNLWRWLGGYPPAAFVGPDAAIHSILMKHAPDRRIWVQDGNPLYWLRDHPEQETKTHTQRFSEEMTSIRTKLTEDFVPNSEVVLR